MGIHLHLIDHYHKHKSPIHDLDCRAKLIFTIALLFICTLLPVGSWPAYGLIFSLLSALIYVSNIGFVYLFKRSVMVLPFLLAAMPLMFQTAGITLFTIPVGNLLLSVSTEGLIRFISLGIKSWLSVVAVILLASTTSFPELLRAMRYMKIPKLLVSVFSLMWRYLLLMIEEVDRLMRARLSRSSKDPAIRSRTGKNIFWRARVTGSMAGSLFIRSLERSERVYQAMLSRGYDGEIRLLEDTALERKTIFRMVLVIVMLFLLTFLVSSFNGV